jgi:hypothetical protein
VTDPSLDSLAFAGKLVMPLLLDEQCPRLIPDLRFSPSHLVRKVSADISGRTIHVTYNADDLDNFRNRLISAA